VSVVCGITADGTRRVRLIRNFRIGTSLSNRIRVGTFDSNSNRISKLRRSLLLLYGIQLSADLDRDRHVGGSRPNQNDYFFL